ncbi:MULTISPECIES: antitoxin [Derxia]|uniref:Antitoxin n=1 Tax=Derxia gummosa DSM 723 TaxID=1121388 RepID=A0A8B6X579_9BURK|nr:MULTISPECIES: AbrB/MazE/SpoVT family DNA-binding domain-containing protein [Derxia]
MTLEERTVSIFRNGRNQAIRIPREFELSGTQALMRREGSKLIIEPLQTGNRLLAFLDAAEPLDESLPEIEDTPAADEDVL